MPIRRQAIIWTNDGLGWWHIYALFSLNELNVKWQTQGQDYWPICWLRARHKPDQSSTPMITRGITLTQLYINSLRPGDTIWRHGSGSTLAQIIASRQQNIPWNNVDFFYNQWGCYAFLYESNFTASGQATILYNYFENYTLKLYPPGPDELTQ